MMVYLAFFLIFVGVTFALYQVYSVHYAINFDDEEERPEPINRDMKTLVEEAGSGTSGEPSPGFESEVRRLFGQTVSTRLVLTAVHSGYLEPLLRRRRRVDARDGLTIAHLPFWKTRPPARYPRGPILTCLIICSLLALFWGGMSVFTLGYPLPGAGLAWANHLGVLTALVYASALLSWGAARLDGYLHDIQQIGRLSTESSV
ncbi:hypothetical protein OM427_25035 [Halomonas sp. 18H]|uniref:hypothetical protein n=1 Tax=Halomonas almeriensis TaxID=308163 RepID=UPI0022324E73|nr:MULTISPECIES: hypothetical protein [Halomonas]MCW4152784.1 hypothetical protein [Halomonas sp. 18H]MDN3552017.1 hypothetical protein [Halomonas almeriensis]